MFHATHHVRHAMEMALINVSHALFQSLSLVQPVSINVQMECSTTKRPILVTCVMQLVNHAVGQLTVSVALVKVCFII